MDVATKIISKDRRQQIIDAASDLFSNKGYYATRMTDIAHYIGVTKPVVYRYFDSKEKLFSEWFDEVIANEYDELVHYIMHSSDHARTITKNFLDAYGKMVIDPLMLSPHRIAIMEAGVCPEIAKSVYYKVQARFIHAIHHLFERALKDSSIKGGDSLILAHLFMSPVCANILQHTAFDYQIAKPEHLHKFYNIHYDSFWEVWGT